MSRVGPEGFYVGCCGAASGGPEPGATASDTRQCHGARVAICVGGKDPLQVGAEVLAVRREVLDCDELLRERTHDLLSLLGLPLLGYRHKQLLHGALDLQQQLES